jgi:hypothetical protein
MAQPQLDAALGINMPPLPITERLTRDIPNEKLAPTSTADMAASMQERRGVEAGLRGQALQAESDILRAEQEQKVAGLESKQANLQKEATELAGMPERQTLKQSQESLKNAAFIPSKDNAEDIATFFSLMGIVGMAIGGGGKENAYAAMAGMNGMLEGYKKGRADIYKRERDMFEKNFKAMQTKVQIARDELADAVMLKTKNFEAGRVAEEVAIAKTGSPVLEATLKKQGALETLKTLDGINADVSSLDKRKNDLYKQEQDRKFKERELAQQAELKRAQLANTAEMARARLENQGQKITQQNMMAQRAVNSLGGVASALESLAELPSGTTTGLLPNLQTKDGFLNYVRNNIGRKLATNEAEMMNTVFTGIGRNLASIEASGAATGLTQLANQMQSGLYINEGTDDPYRVAIKLADIRRIATENIRPAIESGLMPEGQARTAEALVKRIEQAIPFTTIDVIRSARPPGAQTIGEQTSRVVGGGEGGGWSQDKEKRLRELQEKKAAREAKP